MLVVEDVMETARAGVEPVAAAEGRLEMAFESEEEGFGIEGKERRGYGLEKDNWRRGHPARGRLRGLVDT